MINQRYRLEFVTHLKKKHNIDLEKEWSKFIGNSTYLEMRTLYRDWETDRKSTRLNSSHSAKSRMPSSA